MAVSSVPRDARRAYRDLSTLPLVVAADVECEAGRLMIRLEIASGVDRVLPSVLRVAAEHDLGLCDLERSDRPGDGLLLELGAEIGGVA